MTNTVLTKKDIAEALVNDGIVLFAEEVDAYDVAFARTIEQAVLQSPEVQALIIASQEFNDLYGWLWDTTEGGGFLSPDGVKRYDAAHHNLSVALCKITGRPLPIDPGEDDE